MTHTHNKDKPSKRTKRPRGMKYKKHKTGNKIAFSKLSPDARVTAMLNAGIPLTETIDSFATCLRSVGRANRMQAKHPDKLVTGGGVSNKINSTIFVKMQEVMVKRGLV